MATLKKSLEDDSQVHEAAMTEMRHKHSQELQTVNEQLETIKKAKSGLEKHKQNLEAENADLTTELRSIGASRQESTVPRFPN